MGDELADQGGQRPESRSGFIDDACSRFETAWQTGQPPRIEDFLPPQSPDKGEGTQLALLVSLVGIDLEWRWKTAGGAAETQSVAEKPSSPAALSETMNWSAGEGGIDGQEARPDTSGSSVPLPLRPRLSDYVARYPLLGAVEGLPDDLIVAEYYARSRYGDRPTHAEYLDAFGVRHPELAKQLQSVDDGIAAAGRLPSDLVSEDGPPLGGTVRYFGDYVLMERLGKGGMGVVYKANQASLKRLVAVKMILAGQLADEQDVARFRSEAESAASLDHPNIVQIYEIGEHQRQHYFSMRYVEGESLADRLKTSPLPAREAARLVEQVARAIAYAHSRGVIHRDLKPANILVDRQNQPQVTDFGLAKRVQGDSDLTASGKPIGTPSYMSPEQAAGRLQEISERSDVYSLGATLYALLVGRPPFQADNPLDTLVQVREQEPVSLRQLNPKLPRDLETVCAKCLEKDPRRRYGSADELAEELKRFLEGRPIQARPVGRAERFWRWCKRQPVVAGLSATAAVLVVLVAVVASIGYAVTSRALAVAKDERKAADIERQKAEAALERVIQGQAAFLKVADPDQLAALVSSLKPAALQAAPVLEKELLLDAPANAAAEDKERLAKRQANCAAGLLALRLPEKARSILKLSFCKLGQA
jgi:predicted Ser/Thr protein kinase